MIFAACHCQSDHLPVQCFRAIADKRAGGSHLGSALPAQITLLRGLASSTVVNTGIQSAGGRGRGRGGGGLQKKR